MSTADDPRSPYLQIVEDLRRSIATGKINPGDKLPSNAELKRTYGVAGQTAQNAINALKTEGLVYGVAGRGVFVRSDLDLDDVRARVATDDPAQLNEDLLRQVEVLTAGVARLNDLVATMDERLRHLEGQQASDTDGQSDGG